MKAITLEPISRIEGEINLPGSKSLSNRALLLAALAKGTTTVSYTHLDVYKRQTKRGF